MKKVLDEDGDWLTTKEILGWVVDTNKGTLSLPPKRKAELLSLLNIPTTCCCMSVKLLERLIGNLWSIHIALTDAIGHFYAMQVALTRAWAANGATS